MKSNQLLIIAVVIVLGAWGLKVYAGTLTMNTYYPSPNGYYDTLTVKSKFFYPCYTSRPAVFNPPPANAPYLIDATCPTPWPWGP